MMDVLECIDEIGRSGSSIFKTIYLTSGFWQMMLNPLCRKYTAFTLPGLGQFKWNPSPMGLLGAPGSYQGLMVHYLKKNCGLHWWSFSSHNRSQFALGDFGTIIHLTQETWTQNQSAKIILWSHKSQLFGFSFKAKWNFARKWEGKSSVSFKAPKWHSWSQTILGAV